jgi:hypothetical protein
MDIDQARDAVGDAARAQGLVNAADPIIVMRADDVRDAMVGQAVKLGEILAPILALWLLAAFFACRRELRKPKGGSSP